MRSELPVAVCGCIIPPEPLILVSSALISTYYETYYLYLNKHLIREASILCKYVLYRYADAFLRVFYEVRTYL